MTTFLQRVLVFSIFGLLLVESISYGLRATGCLEYYITGKEVHQSIRKSKEKVVSKKILLGDSVAFQLFDNQDNPYINSLACNRAISMAGHYFLLKNYMEAGNDVDTVFMICTPFSFKNNLNEIYTYHYFLKPFSKPAYRPFFTENLKQQLAKTPYHFLLNSQYILATDWAPSFEKQEQKESFSFLSPISKDYLEKLKDLSLQYDFDCIFIPAPTRKSRQMEVQQLDPSELKGLGFEKELTHFLNAVDYFSDDYFVDEDHLHRNHEADFALKVYQKYLVGSR